MRDARVREPVLFAVAFCVADKIHNPLSGAAMDWDKSSFVYLVLIVDFACIFMFICFINFLNKRFKEYSEVFDKRNVEMRDFTIEVENLPFDFEYGGKDLMLSAQLWNHFESFVRESMEASAIANEDWEKLE